MNACLVGPGMAWPGVPLFVPSVILNSHLNEKKSTKITSVSVCVLYNQRKNI